jgi:NAD(P)-dependent dehydrogenase (short-subunit alcohol dehydrogenase family)
MKLKSILITGVSTGIGRDIADFFLANGWFVIGTARRSQDLEEFNSQANFHGLIMDVCNEDEVRKSSKVVERLLEGNNLNALVNNAGIAVGGPLLHLSSEEVERQFSVNVFGVMHMIRHFAPLLGARRNAGKIPGKIIMMSSVSGLVTSPFTGIYSASKFALEAITDGLRRELMPYGVDVIAVEPGPIKTPIWDKSIAEVRKFEETDYKPALQNVEKYLNKQIENALDPKRVTKAVWDACTSPNPRSRYIVSKNSWLFPIIKSLPDRWLDGFMKNTFKGMDVK